MDSTGLGLYLHVPFCVAKCSYCDFNTYAGLDHLYQPYLDAITQEVHLLSRTVVCRVHSIFLGGGTPTVLPAAALEQLLSTCVDAFDVEAEAEITSEANPGTVTTDYLQALRSLGINRISLGVQSFHPSELAMLGRIHSAEQVGLTVQRARAAGFNNINLDLIYGLPHQTLSSWRETMERALALDPEHLSLYCLTLEKGTPLLQRVSRGRLPLPDPDLAADMYDLAEELLAAAGYRQYEISNWSRPGYECAHNLVYWRNQPYLGLGAGAHSSTGGMRWWNVRPVPAYIRRVAAGETAQWPSPAAEDGEVISRALEMGETMMLGLRLTEEGVSAGDFQQRFSATLEETYGLEIRRMQDLGLLTWRTGRLRLTPRGRLLGNQVFAEFLPSDQ
jgi:oxygen-independent coproporphyrinogen-3 oxidase